MPDEPGWYPDPKGEANFRFYDGRKWTKSVAAERPDAQVASDGPVVGGLMGLLDHRPERVPMGLEDDPEPLWGREQPLLDPVAETAPPPPPPPSAPAPPPPPPPPPRD